CDKVDKEPVSGIWSRQNPSDQRPGFCLRVGRRYFRGANNVKCLNLHSWMQVDGSMPLTSARIAHTSLSARLLPIEATQRCQTRSAPARLLALPLQFEKE